MNWLGVAVVTIGIFVWVGRRGRWISKPRKEAPPAEEQAPPPEVERVEEAIRSGDIQKMLDSETLEMTNFQRHQLLAKICETAYRKRQEPDIRDILRKYAGIYLDAFPALEPEVRREMGDSFSKIYAFRDIARFYDEEGEFDHAIAVCETARQYQIEDGTKTGFAGRIERIQKKREMFEDRTNESPEIGPEAVE